MGPADILKSAVKPPFANYDIVVYFGCGLFLLPFLRHYVVEPFGLRFPIFNFQIGIEFVDGLITALSLLFAVYILGHVIAYGGSQLIEKAVDAALDGKTSAIVNSASKATDDQRKSLLRARLRSGWRRSWSKQGWFTALIRYGTHFPAAIAYGLIYILGMFGFYSTRVEPTLFDAAATRLRNLKLGIEVGEDGRWFKALEAVVINKQPVATARMYNYLVISGLFRSIALIFLFALWMELLHLVLWKVCGWEHIGFFLSDRGGVLRWLFGYFVLTTLYCFALFSFLKFQRRYVEDAIFAFVLSSDD
ncbi:MAG: hypothetical protein ABIO43_09250 [Sphingomicrobium sp.]